MKDEGNETVGSSPINADLSHLQQNTDPSMKEYEATLSMVDDIENIVLTIEDEKTSAEEKERTRDVFARIDGLENEKVSYINTPSSTIGSKC